MKVHIGKYRKNRRINIQIDPWDTWDMNSTLSLIILPMLKQLKATKQGSAFVDLEDVPENLRFTTTEVYNSQYTFDFYREHELKEGESDIHARWDWVIDEMIWAFEQLQPDCDWEDQYWKVKPEIDFEKYPEDEGKDCYPIRWKVKGECDWKARQIHADRIQNGLELFGKYFKGLWD